MSGFSQSEALLLAGDGASPEVFAAVAQVLSMTPPKKVYSTTKKWVFGSDDPMVFTGRPDDQTVQLEVALDRGLADHAAFEDNVGGAARNFRIDWPDGFSWAFAAKITAFEPGELSAESSDPFTASITLTLSSAITRSTTP